MFDHSMSLNFVVKTKHEDSAEIPGEDIIQVLEAKIAEIRGAPKEWDRHVEVYDSQESLAP